MGASLARHLPPRPAVSLRSPCGRRRRRPASRRAPGRGLAAWVLAAAGVLLAVLVAPVRAVRPAPRRALLRRRRPAPRVGLPRPAAADPADRAPRRPASRPGSLVALHLPSALAAAAVVVLAALTARELGGGTGAQLLTAVATGTGVVVVTLGHILSTTTIDTLFWVAIVYVVLRTLSRDAPRGWLVVGLLAGLGAAGQAPRRVPARGDRRRRRADARRSGTTCARRGPGRASVSRVLLWLPNLAVAGDARVAAAGARRRHPRRVLRARPAAGVRRPAARAVQPGRRGAVDLRARAAAARAGAGACASRWRGRSCVLVVVFLVTGGKAYYVVGAVPVLLAAGRVRAGGALVPRGLVVAGVVLALSAFVAWPAALPLLPERTFGAVGLPGDQRRPGGDDRLARARRRPSTRPSPTAAPRSSSPRTTARPARSSGTGPTCRCSAGTTGTPRGGRRPTVDGPGRRSSGTRARRTGRSGAGTVARGRQRGRRRQRGAGRRSCRCATGRAARGPTCGTRSRHLDA